MNAENWNEVQKENWRIILEKIKKMGLTGMNLGEITRFAEKNCQKNNYFPMFLENELVDLIMKGILRERKHEYALESHYVWDVKNNGRGKVRCSNGDCETILSIYNAGNYCFRCNKERKIMKVVAPWLLD